MNFTAAGQSNSKEVDESIFQYICCLLLRHITQLVCNGHAIYDVGACDTGIMYIHIFFWGFAVFIWLQNNFWMNIYSFKISNYEKIVLLKKEDDW